MLCFRILWTTGVNTSMTTMDRGRSLQCWGDSSTWSGTGLVGSGGAPASPDRGVRGRWGPALLPGAPGALTTMCRGGGGPALLPRPPAPHCCAAFCSLWGEDEEWAGMGPPACSRFYLTVCGCCRWYRQSYLIGQSYHTVLFNSVRFLQHEGPMEVS